MGRGASDGGDKPHYEFFGPLGVSFLMILLPAVTIGLVTLCTGDYCLETSLGNLGEGLARLKDMPLPHVTWSLDAYWVVCAWFGLIVVLRFVLPGFVTYGVPLRNGTRLPYVLNGFLSLFAAVGLTVFCIEARVIDATWAYDHFLELQTAALVFSTLMAVLVYLLSFRPGVILADGGDSGNVIYDFFIGRQLNPRIGSLDLKCFCELRPGLIGWVVLNICFAYTQAARTGLTTSMILINVFQAWYVMDGLWSESAILTTMDITTDGFGWMLAFGDLGWVPFVYSLQARYLVANPVALSEAAIVLILAANVGGYFIFRSANGQKDAFRTDPNDPAVSHLKTLATKRGTKLIVSSWWGMARHINYFGDLLLGLSWCMVAGTQHIVPYFYFIYFATLLIHRERRDDEGCAKKYGDDWKTYCEMVPYRIIPYIY